MADDKTKQILDADMFTANQDLVTFQKFSSRDKAAELIDVLKTNDIIFEVLDNPPTVVLSLYGVQEPDEIIIKLRQTDFTKANDLLNKIAQDNLANLNKDHYLFEFTDEELLEILQKSDEWSKDDYLIAQKILIDRGKKYSKEQLIDFKRQRLQTLAKPESGNKLWTVLGYIFALFGGLFGVFIGWHLIAFKKTLPNGQKVLAYDKQSQKHGQNILIIGIVCFIGWLVYVLK